MVVNQKKMAELDSHWDEVMALAEKYGFVTAAYGGVAAVSTHENQLKMLGEERYLDKQRNLFGNDMEEKNE